MSKLLAARALRVMAALAIVGGAANAFATGNGGACAMHIHQVNTAFPGPIDGRPGGPDPVWQAFAGQCSGPCPPPGGRCDPGVIGTTVVNGTTFNVVDCQCVTTTPGGQIISVQYDTPAVDATLPCKTLMLVNQGPGTFAGYACQQSACPSPCILKPDPNITQWDVEVGGEWYMARSVSCGCP